MNNRRQINITVPEELYLSLISEVRSQSVVRGKLIPLAEVVREAITAYLPKHESPQEV